MSKGCLPKHIREGKHTDYWWPFNNLPRSWTSFCWMQPPSKLAGNQPQREYPTFAYMLACKPTPDPGEWQLSWPLYFAFTTKRKLSFRIGARWDDVDFYYTFPSFRLWRLK